MEPSQRYLLVGIITVVFTTFYLLTMTTLSTAHHAVDVRVKKRLPGTLPSHRPVRREGRNFTEPERVAIHSGDRASTNFTVPLSASDFPKRSSIIFRPSLMARGAVPLTDDTYFNFIEANPIVLVLFYAPWCSWSRKTLPEFESAARVLAKEQSGDPAILLAKVDCTLNEEVMLQEEIEDFPTLKLFVQGRPKVYDGGRQRADILRWVQLNMNQGRTIRSIDSLKEILASRALGTLVVIAAWGPHSKIAGDTAASSDSQSSRDTKKVKGEDELLPTAGGTSLPQEQKALRSVMSHKGEKADSSVSSSVLRSVSGPAAGINRQAQPIEEASLGKRSQGLQHRDRKEVIHAQHPHRSQLLRASHRDTFLHVARVAGSDVIFGETTTPEVVKFLMEKYIRPHSDKKTPAHIQFPLIAAFPAKVETGLLGDNHKQLSSEEFRLYTGTLNNARSMTDFVRASKFPLVVPFTEFWAPRIFEDGRPVCVLFVDRSSSEVNTPEQTCQISVGKEALLKVAPEFRMGFLFTLAGNSKPHEKRLLTLLGMEEDTSFPQFRIVKFSSQGNKNHFPAVKYRPAAADNGGSARTLLQSACRDGLSKNSEERKEVSVDLPRSGTGGLRTATTVQDFQKGSRACKGDTLFVRKSEHKRGRAVYRVEQELRKFLASYLEGSLKPYLRSEPVPSDEENSGALKILVGSTFEQLVRASDEDVLVEFGAPWCGHCRKLEPTLRVLAAAFRESNSSIVLAKIDATRNEVKGLYFAGYPSLILFPSRRKESPLIYKGERTEEKLLEWLSRNVRGEQINIKQVRKLLEERSQQPIAPQGMGKPRQRSAGSRQPYVPPAEHSVLEEL